MAIVPEKIYRKFPNAKITVKTYDYLTRIKNKYIKGLDANYKIIEYIINSRNKLLKENKELKQLMKNSNGQT